MQCHDHAQRTAIGRCIHCGKALCPECAAADGSERMICHACIAREAVQDMGRDLRSRADRQTGEDLREARRAKRRQLVRWGLLIVFSAIAVFHGPATVSLLREGPKPIRQGTYATDRPADDCIRNLWRISQSLQQKTPPDPSLCCPVSGRAYRVVRKDGTVTFNCPNPSRHGLRSLQISNQTPYPIVLK